MLSAVVNYAISSGLPYEFVEWFMDLGYSLDDNVNLDTFAHEWRVETDTL